MQVQSIILLAVLGEKLNVCPPQPGLMDSFSLLSDAQLSLVFLDNLQQMPQDESNKPGTQGAVQVEGDKGHACGSSDNWVTAATSIHWVSALSVPCQMVR